MIKIQKIAYVNEGGELITVDFAETDIEYRVDRIQDLVREMMSGGRDLGPPPKLKNTEPGEVSAW